jgi:hypothetical protein
MRSRLIPFLLVSLIAGCGLLGKQLEKPSVHVDGVAIADVSWNGARGSLDLTVTNPNAIGLPLSKIDWQLAVHGDHAVSGSIDLHQEIPAKGSAPVQTALSIATSDVIHVAPHLAAGARDYRLSARLHFSTTLGDLSVDVVHDGTL